MKTRAKLLLAAGLLGAGAIAFGALVPKHLMYGGALATGSGLVFFAEPQGWLDAVDAATGKTLWRYRVEESYLGPPVSFLVDGHQRVAITSRRGVTLFGLPDTR